MNTRDFELYRKELAAFLCLSFLRRGRAEDLDTFLNGLREAPRRNAAIAAIACGGFRRTPRHEAQHATRPRPSWRTWSRPRGRRVRGSPAHSRRSIALYEERTSEQRDDERETLVVALEPDRQARLPAPLDHLLGTAGHRSKIGPEHHHRRPAQVCRPSARRNGTITTSCSRASARLPTPTLSTPISRTTSGLYLAGCRGADEVCPVFPLFPPAIDVLMALSYHLTTARSSIHFMHANPQGSAKRRQRVDFALADVRRCGFLHRNPSAHDRRHHRHQFQFNNEWRAYEVAARPSDRPPRATSRSTPRGA